MEDKISVGDKEDTNTNSERTESSKMSSQDDLRMIVSEALEQVIADVILKTAQKESVLKAVGHSQSTVDDHSMTLEQILSDALCRHKSSTETVDQPTEMRHSQVPLREESRLRTMKDESENEQMRITKDEPENEQMPITPVTSDVLESFLTSLLQHIVSEENEGDAVHHGGEANARKDKHSSELAVRRLHSPVVQRKKTHSLQSSSSVIIEALISNILKDLSVKQHPQSGRSAKDAEFLASEFPEQHVSQTQSTESQKSTSSQSVVGKDAFKEICSDTLKSLSSEIIQQIVADILVSAANSRSTCNEDSRAQAPMQKLQSNSIVTSSFSDFIQNIIEDLLKYRSESDHEQISHFRCDETAQERNRGTSKRKTDKEQTRNDTSLAQKRSHQIKQEDELLASQLLNIGKQTKREQELNTGSLLKSLSSEVIEDLVETVLKKVLGSGGSLNIPHRKPTEIENMDEEGEFKKESLIGETLSSTVQPSQAQSKTRSFGENSERSVHDSNVKSHSSGSLSELIYDILNLAKTDVQKFSKTKTGLAQKRSEQIIHQDRPLGPQLLKADQRKPEKELSSNLSKSQSSVVIESLIETVLKKILVGNDGSMDTDHMEPTEKENLDEERGFEEDPLVGETAPSTNQILQAQSKTGRFDKNSVSSELSCKLVEKEKEEKMEDSNVKSHSSSILSQVICDILNLKKSDVKRFQNFERPVPVTLCDSAGLVDHRQDDDDDGFKRVFSEIIHNVLLKIVQSTRLHQTDSNCNLQHYSETIELEHIVPNVSTSLVNNKEKPDSTASAHRVFSALRSASVEEPHSADDIRTVGSPSTNTIEDFANGVLTGQQGTSSAENGTISGTSGTSSLSSCALQKIVEEVLYQCMESEPMKSVDSVHQLKVESPRSLSDHASGEERTRLRNLLIESVSSSLIEKVILDVLTTVAEQNKREGSPGNILETNYSWPASKSESLSNVSSFDVLSKVIVDILMSVTSQNRNSDRNKSDFLESHIRHSR